MRTSNVSFVPEFSHRLCSACGELIAAFEPAWLEDAAGALRPASGPHAGSAPAVRAWHAGGCLEARAEQDAVAAPMAYFLFEPAPRRRPRRRGRTRERAARERLPVSAERRAADCPPPLRTRPTR